MKNLQRKHTNKTVNKETCGQDQCRLRKCCGGRCFQAARTAEAASRAPQAGVQLVFI